MDVRRVVVCDGPIHYADRALLLTEMGASLHPDCVILYDDAAHPEEVRAAVGTYTKINDVVRTAMILPSWPNDINRPSLERLATLGRTDGIFTKPPVLDELLP